VIAVHLFDLRRTERGSCSLLLSMLGIGTTFVSGRVGGGIAAFSCVAFSCPFSRGACVTFPTLGIEIVFGREGQLGTRTIGITAMSENRPHSTVSTVSRVSDDGHGAGLNRPPPGVEQVL
jgi:hypothetical protein